MVHTGFTDLWLVKVKVTLSPRQLPDGVRIDGHDSLVVCTAMTVEGEAVLVTLLA